jgi:hypothetical protein
MWRAYVTCNSLCIYDYYLLFVIKFLINYFFSKNLWFILIRELIYILNKLGIPVPCTCSTLSLCLRFSYFFPSLFSSLLILIKQNPLFCQPCNWQLDNVAQKVGCGCGCGCECLIILDFAFYKFRLGKINFLNSPSCLFLTLKELK